MVLGIESLVRSLWTKADGCGFVSALLSCMFEFGHLSAASLGASSFFASREFPGQGFKAQGPQGSSTIDLS